MGVGAFAVVAANNASPGIGEDAAGDALRAVALLAAAVPVALLVVPRLGNCPRRLAWTVCAGAAFGFAAALTRIATGQLTAEGAAGVPPVAVVGLVVAALVGAWCVQQSHHTRQDRDRDLPSATSSCSWCGLGAGMTGAAVRQVGRGQVR